MSTETDPELDWVPPACTLPTAERPVRLAEFDRLISTAVRTAERSTRTRLRLALTGADDLEATVRDLTTRESQCCSFFAFSVTPKGSGIVILDIEVPMTHVDVLDALTARAEAAR